MQIFSYLCSKIMMNYELSSFYSNYNLGAKVVKNHELCKSLLYFLRVILLHVLNIGLLFGKWWE